MIVFNRAALGSVYYVGERYTYSERVDFLGGSVDHIYEIARFFFLKHVAFLLAMLYDVT